MVLRLGINARRTGTGGHREFAGNPGTQMVSTSGRDTLTWLRDQEAAVAGSRHHTARYPGTHPITLGVVGDQATTRLPGTQPSGHMHAGIAARTGGDGTAICHGLYQQRHPRVTVSYSAVGSSAGIAAFSARQVDFGASDVPMTASEQAAASGGPVAQVPVAGRRRGGLQPQPPGRRPAAPDGPGARGHLPRADQPLE